MSKLIKFIAVTMILVFTLIPAGIHVSRIVSGHASSTGENRALASWPKWDQAYGDFARYTGLISTHLNDQFGGRTLAIRVRNKLFNIMGDGTASVLKGQTPGWYFYNSPYMEQSYRGALPYNMDDVEIWTQSLVRLQNSVVENGAVFAAMIPPDKARIYPEHAPARLGKPSDKRFAADIVENAKKRGVTMIDIDLVLRANKANGAMFYQTDTHWTLRGAYEAYAAIMTSYETQGRAFSLINSHDMQRVEQTDFSGDLASMMGLEGALTETLTDFSPPKTAREFKKQVLSDPTASRAIWQTEIYSNGDENSQKTLVIIGDSFSRQLLPYFQQSFDKIVFMHHRRGSFDLDNVLAHNPDAVLFAPVEREAVRLKDFARIK